MFSFISNIPIFRRLFYAFMLAAVIPGIVIFILGFSFINRLHTRSDAVMNSISASQDARNADAAFSSVATNMNILYTGQYQNGENRQMNQAMRQRALGQLKASLDQLDTILGPYQGRYQLADGSEMTTVREIILSDSHDEAEQIISKQQSALNQVLTPDTGLWPQYRQAARETYEKILANKPKAQVDVSLNAANSFYRRTPALNTIWGQVITTTEQAREKVAEVGPSLTNPIYLTTIIAFFCTIIVVVGIGYIVNLTITRPLRQLATLTKRIAKGETSARAKIVGRDEIYMVATSMNNMLDNIVRLIQETQSQRDALQSQVEKLVSEVSGVGEGDLRVQAEVTADALGVLADSFNYMVEELGSLVVRVKMVSSEVENSTTAILDRMTHLVETEDTQVQQISQAAVEIEDLAGSSRLVANRSQVLYEVAHTARRDAQVGRESVRQAIEGIGRINENVQATADKVQNLGERSREINEIVDAISSISHQTNRLALDAAIQAAMAGENGKGFGAVAADIRRLAERSKDQTNSVMRIVRSIREEIGAVAVSMQDTERETAAGSQLTQEVGGVLESIFSAVEQQAREIENINKVAMQQQESSTSIVHIMHAISDLTQQAGISTREASQNMERLARLVEQLRASVEAFKLRDSQGYFNPANGTNVTMEQDENNPLTVSGVFRTVTASAQAPQIPAGFQPFSPDSPFVPEEPDSAFALFSGTTNKQIAPRGNGNGNNGNNGAWNWDGQQPFNDRQWGS